MYISPDENFSHIYFNFFQNFWDSCCPAALTDEPPWCSLCTKITASRNNTNEQKKNHLITLKAICTMHIMTMVLGQASVFFNSTVIHKETSIQNTWAFVVMWLKCEFICITLVSVNVFSPSWHRIISWIGILLAPNNIHITTEFWKIKTHFIHFHYNFKRKQPNKKREKEQFKNIYFLTGRCENTIMYANAYKR